MGFFSQRSSSGQRALDRLDRLTSMLTDKLTDTHSRAKIAIVELSKTRTERDLLKQERDSLAAKLCKPARKTSRRTSSRNKQPASDFALPGKRYPLYDAYHATLALSHLLRVAGRHGPRKNKASRKKEARLVIRAVRKRWPGVYACEGDLLAKVRKAHRLGS